MQKHIRILSLTFCLMHSVVYSQQKQLNTIIFRGSDQTEVLPVVALGEALHLSFDDLENLEEDYYYYIELIIIIEIFRKL